MQFDPIITDNWGMTAGYTPTIAFFDSPKVINASVTNIPKASSAPMEVIAETPNLILEQIHVLDAIAEFIGVYTGPAGSEVLHCIIGGGKPFFFPSKIKPRSRVSLRNMEDFNITSGQLCCQFFSANAFRP